MTPPWPALLKGKHQGQSEGETQEGDPICVMGRDPVPIPPNCYGMKGLVLGAK